MGRPDKPQLRLALRVEGDWWNAYVALPDTMEGARLIGSVRFDLAQDPAVKGAFMEAMRLAVQAALQRTGSEVTGWGGTVPAPEHERSGRA